jgi:aminoglycoside phosphotransferase (APT) family kinase protein
MADLSIHSFLPDVRDYLHKNKQVSVPGWSHEGDFEVQPLGQGEYNMNFLVKQNNHAWVLRVNSGSQIGFSTADQIAYEYQTLQLLAPLDISPMPLFLDNTCKFLPYGILGMAYYPGEALDYRHDLVEAAQLFAQYHQLKVPEENNHLIRETETLSLTHQRCGKMLDVYFNSDLADPALKSYLREVYAWADEARKKEVYFINDPWHCIINTEVNNTNWILNRQTGDIHLTDWEKPLWGDPSQDLSHFRVPTTTLWKTDYRMSPRDKAEMMSAYKHALTDAHLRGTIEERTRLRDPFNCLRGVSWCAMAWVQYQQNEHLVKNEDTFKKFSMYTDLAFVRSLFDPYLTT